MAELQQAFDEQTAGVLLNVLDKIVTQVYQVGVPREDFRELSQTVTELAEAQQRTEQRVAELAEAQQRTEQRVAELAEAQRRSEERLSRLESAIEQLVHAIDGLRKQVGGLSDVMGGDIEDVAHGVVYATLRREFGWQVSMLEQPFKS